MTESISKSAFTALRWNYLGFVTRSGSNFLIGILLARLLGPKPYGQLGAVALVVGIANLLADAGFSDALIQSPEITPRNIRYVFSMQCLIALLLTGGVCALSSFVAEAFHDPAIRLVLIGLSPVFLLQAVGQTSNALLRRQLSFKSIQTFQVSSYLISYLFVGVPLAFHGAGVWTLVSAQLVQAAIYSGLLYTRVRHSVIPSFRNGGAHLLKFGAKVTTNNFANWGISNLDNAIVGHAFGSIGLGLYNRAFSLGSSVADGVISTLQQVLFASCSRAEGRLDVLRKAYLACLSSMALVIFPAFWTMAACPATVVVGLYGEKWRGAVPLFQPLAMALSIHALMAIGGPILAAMNLIERETKAQGVILLVAVCSLLAAVRYSILVLAWCVLGIYIFRFVVITWPVLTAVQLSWRRVGRAILGPACIGSAVTLILAMVNHLCGWEHLRPSVSLLCLIATGAVSFVALMLLAGRHVLSDEVRSLLRRDVSDLPAWAQVAYARVLTNSGQYASDVIG